MDPNFGEFLSYLGTLAREWPMGTITASLIVVVLVIMVGTIVAAIMTALDSFFLPHHRNATRVMGKKFIPAHKKTVKMYDTDSKMFISCTVEYEDEWFLEVELDGRARFVPVTQSVYSTVDLDEFVFTEYTVGRVTKLVHLLGVL